MEFSCSLGLYFLANQDDECWQNNMYKTCRNDGVVWNMLHLNQIRNISLVLINTNCDRCNFYAYILFTHLLSFWYIHEMYFMNMVYSILWIYYIFRIYSVQISHLIFIKFWKIFVVFEWSQSRITEIYKQDSFCWIVSFSFSDFLIYMSHKNELHWNFSLIFCFNLKAQELYILLCYSWFIISKHGQHNHL